MKRRQLVAACAAAAAAWSTPRAFAQAYPERPIKIYQGFAPGGNADAIARAVGLEMGKALGQPIVVEAQSGAGGTIAARRRWRAPGPTATRCCWRRVAMQWPGRSTTRCRTSRWRTSR
ncbi:tripartite tricarboxylate transporter substrate-binding protein [Variovorax sp. J31P207]|uniref:tripartite tricarboxylate transporter substrate-binding protein n=1 Tax=Variovorax sp. J31P207 TaxID=3053510 RepID=UPI0025784C81|nr:tripartite tricarboxylate transporter substrate-binding protein [Variovorax sp. J31P207]MDM0068478.1 tripartite tricarboxylate transporter substrate-binding protein [Variovorax sp. J31P207]